MKNIMKITLGFILISVISLTSCKKWIDTDVNISPNNPVDVPVHLLLAGVQAEMAYTMMGNDVVRPTNMWLQYLNGNSRQSLTQGRYAYKAADVNNLWNTAYAGIMMDLVQMLDKTKDEDGNIVSPHYSGVAKVLLAWNLVLVSDLYGDIPYIEAFLGEENLTPKLDSQSDIYGVAQAFLTEAIADFAVEESIVSPDEEDMFYEGDLDMWTALAWALKAKYELNTSEAGGSFANVLTYADNAMNVENSPFTSNAGNMSFTFNGDFTSPLFQFNDERGDVQMATTFVDFLIADGDLRIGEYVAENEDEDYVGSEPGTDQSGPAYSDMGDYVMADDATIYMMTYSELLFIIAEAELRGGVLADAYQAYLDAGVASVMQVTDELQVDVEADSWYSGVLELTGGAADLDLEQLMYQKYLAGFGTPTAFNDYRRVGFPILSAPSEATGPMPLRFPYPQNEIDYNENISFISLSTPVWWDK